MPSEPILKDTGTIRHQDALLVYDKEELLRDEHGRPITRQDPEAIKLHPITGEADPRPGREAGGLSLRQPTAGDMARGRVHRRQPAVHRRQGHPPGAWRRLRRLESSDDLRGDRARYSAQGRRRPLRSIHRQPRGGHYRLERTNKRRLSRRTSVRDVSGQTLVPAIANRLQARKTWTPGTRPGMICCRFGPRPRRDGSPRGGQATMPRKQLDLFPDDPPEPSDPEQAPVAYSPDPEHVRQRLHRILAEAQAASVVPWDPARLASIAPSSPDDPLAARRGGGAAPLRVRGGDGAAESCLTQPRVGPLSYDDYPATGRRGWRRTPMPAGPVRARAVPAPCHAVPPPVPSSCTMPPRHRPKGG